MGDSGGTDQSRRREVGHAIAAADPSAREIGERDQRGQVQEGRDDAGGRGPLEFDGNGFPVAQRTPSFVTRVARLLRAS
jgi:hypothetical protein